MAVESHQAKNTSANHLNKFYQTFSELKDMKFDGMIVTGAPVEQMEFEEVDYWNELTEIMDWTESHVTSYDFFCAGLHRQVCIIFTDFRNVSSITKCLVSSGTKF